MVKLRKNFPFRDVFNQFLKEYTTSRIYWYIPKARALTEETVATIKKTLDIVFKDFLQTIWNQDTQDKLLRRLIQEDLLGPYKEGTKPDRTALTRIHKKLWEVLGLAWVEENNEIIITDAGLDLLAKKDHRPIIEAQIAKWQYPNPSGHLRDFKGILPHVFLLQVLQGVDYKISRDEFDLFVNLAQSQEDLGQIVRYINHWRDLNDDEREELMNLVRDIPVPEAITTQLSFLEDEEPEKFPTRYQRIKNDSSYQRDFYTYPRYLRLKNADLVCTSKVKLDKVVNEQLTDLKIPIFKNKADWFAYYGDPEQRPSWLTFLSLEIEKAETKQEAEKIVRQGRRRLTPQGTEEIERKEFEKDIESLYVKNLSQIEEGLKLAKYKDQEGRQFSTPIGRIDLLCRDPDGNYIVIEIKAEEADDSVFGQILRYIGWVHRNLCDRANSVRGIILAGEFPDKARYSRIGLEPLNTNYEYFLQFKKHGLKLQNT